MQLPRKNPLDLNAWSALEAHFQNIKKKTILDHFKEAPQRQHDFCLQWEQFYVDLSKNRFNKETQQLLNSLAEEAGLREAIKAYFGGVPINETEGRAVLHTALRNMVSARIDVEDKNVLPGVAAVKEKMKTFSNAVISGAWKGFSGKAITDIVNIGIGGSDLGPAMVTEALAFYKNHLNIHFISNVEGDHVREIIKPLNPETTLFVTVSKSFTTQETLSNAMTVRKWFLESAPKEAVSQHFVAVSTNLEAVTAFGIAPENIFPMNNWVGGRFSLWSAVGLSICLSVGYPHFEAFLNGAGSMDQHFENSPFEKNIPVQLALLSIWYNNFWGAESEAIIPYTQYLRSLPAYLQQGIMESNGKSVDRNGKPVHYQTGTLIWGASGTNAQHAFFQLMHQGTKLIPADFIGFKESLYGETEHRQKLTANFIAQTEALMCGKTIEKVTQELEAQGMNKSAIEKLAPFKVFEGNRPTNSIVIDRLTPYNLGALIALYEHKIFVQGVIWNIFSYDQWGVELGKQLANIILADFNNERAHPHDESTQNLIQKML